MIKWKGTANSDKNKYTIVIETDSYSSFKAITDACDKEDRDCKTTTKVKKQLNE